MILLKKLKDALYQGVFEFLLIFPIILMGGILLVGGERLWYWIALLFGLFLLGVLIRSGFPNQKWWFASILSLVLGVIPVFLLDLFWPMLIPLAFVQVVFLFRGMMFGGGAQPLPIMFMWFGGFAIYFISYFLIRYIEIFNPYFSLFSICAFISVGVTLLISNQETLKNSTLSKDRKPRISRAMKNQNRVYLLITFIVIVLFSNIGKIREWLWNGFKAFVQWILGDSSTGEIEPIPEEAPPSSGMLPGFPDDEKSAFAEIFYMILTYIAYVFVAGLVVLLLSLMVKRVRQKVAEVVRRFILYIKELLSRALKNEETHEYVDEKESLFDWKEWRQEQQEKAKNMMRNMFKREPRWDSLSNQEKVRYVYRKLLERESLEGAQARTPREILAELDLSDEALLRLLRDAYEGVRYGELEMDERTIQELRAILK